MSYIIAATLAAIISLVLTPQVAKLARLIGAIDKPDGGRKLHPKATPRLGGVAIAAAFFTTALIFIHLSRPFIALILAAIIMVLVGAVDDRRSLSPWVKLGWQVVAAIVALTGGIGISAISNPFGKSLALDWGRHAFAIGGFGFHITPIANLLSIIWIVGMVNAVNFLDGVDGLAGGVSAIASFFMFALAISVHQPAVALLAIILFGAAVGWLPYNFAPARIFLGDSGTYFLGMILALLAIYSGGKLATAVLVLGFTIVDGLLTVLRRLYRHSSPFKADRSHLHHLLLVAGFSPLQTIGVYYLLALLLGLLALVSGTLVKVVTFGLLLIVTALIAAILLRRSNRSAAH